MRIAWFSFMTAVLTMNFIFGCMLTSKVIGPRTYEPPSPLKPTLDKTATVGVPNGSGIDFYEYHSGKMSCLISVHVYAIQGSFTQISCSK